VQIGGVFTAGHGIERGTTFTAATYQYSQHCTIQVIEDITEVQGTGFRQRQAKYAAMIQIYKSLYD